MARSRRSPLLRPEADSARQETLRRFPKGSKVRYTARGRRGTVLDVDSCGQRLLLLRDEVRKGEWEKVVVTVREVERWEKNGHDCAA